MINRNINSIRDKAKLVISKPELFFLTAGLFFGLLFVFVNPPFFGLDERAHFLRTYRIGHGHLFASRIDGHLGAAVPKNIAELVSISTNDLLDNPPNGGILGRHDAGPGKYGRFLHERISSKLVNDTASNTQLDGTFSYNPIVYAYLAIVERVGELAQMPLLAIVYLTRIANLLMYCALVYLAIRLSKEWAWLIAGLALLPVAISQATIVSVDPLLNGAVLLLFAIITRIFYSKRQSSLGLKIAPIGLGALMALAKLPYIFLVLPLLFVPTKSFPNVKKMYLWKAAWVGVPLIVGVLWNRLDNKIIKESVATLATGNYDEQVRIITSQPLHFVGVILRTYYMSIDNLFSSMVGNVGDRQVGLPLVVITIAFVFVVICGAMLHKTTNKPSRILDYALFSTALIVMGVISAGLYLVFSPPGAPLIGGIQGRYILPLLPFFLVPTLPLLPLRSTNTIVTLRTLEFTSSVLLLATLLLYAGANY